MNLHKQLEKAHSKENAKLIADYIDNDAERFDLLMSLFFHENYNVSQRAAHAVSHCVDRHPELIKPYIGSMVGHLNKNPKVAIKRNTVRLLQNQTIPEEHQGLLVEKCFEYLASTHEAIAVRAFSMTILYNMTKIYPELKKELFLTIEDVMQHASSGLLNRGRKVLTQLKK